MQDESASPSFGNAAVRPGEHLATPRWLWPVIILLLLLLAVQIVVAGRNLLGANPATRPVVEAVCGVLHCDVMPLSQPEQLRMLEHGIQAHPTLPGVLVVRASFRNMAVAEQAWPLLQLTLSDVNGRKVSRGRFTPSQYLHGSPPPVIGAGQTASIELNVRDPAQNAVSFDFELLPMTGGVAAPGHTR